MRPVEEYLRTQERFRHLFEPEVKTDAIRRIQASVNGYWKEASAAERLDIKVVE